MHFSFYSELVFEKFRQDSSNIIDDFALYGHTNLATFLFARKLDKLLKGYDISTFVVHPGDDHSLFVRVLTSMVVCIRNV